jgi:hypothetical protein
MKKVYILFIFLAALAGCKEEKLEFTPVGEALYGFKLSGPSNNMNLVLNSATPDDKVVIEWSAAKTGLNAPVIYTFIAAQKGGNLETPLIELKSDNNGADTKLTLTQVQLDEALKSKGIAEGAKADLIWSVKANNGSAQLLLTKPNNISITRFGNGVSILYCMDQNHLLSLSNLMKIPQMKRSPSFGRLHSQVKLVFLLRING